MTEVEQLADRARRARVVWKVAVGAVVVFAVAGFAGALVANVVNTQQDTKIERFSACEQDAKGEACQDMRRRAAEAQTLEIACLTLEQAGYPCPRPGSGIRPPDAFKPVRGSGDSGGAGEPAAAPPSDTSEQTPTASPGSPGGLAPGTGGAVEAPAPQEGGAPPAPQPPSTASNPPSTATTPAPAETPAPVVITPPPAPEPPAPVPARQPIRETVAPVLEGVQSGVCNLAPRLCPVVSP